MEMTVITKQLGMLAIMMLLGFIGVKTKYLKPELKDSISKIILNITLPLLNLTAISSQELHTEMLVNAGIIAALAVVAMAVMLLVGFLWAKIFRLKPATMVMHSCMSASGNVVFLGYPLATALFGPEGFFYAVVYALVNEFLVWTLGLFVITKTTTGNAKAGLKNLVNANTISLVVAVLMLIFKLRLPSVLHEPFATVGSMTTSLSMLFIGITLATINLKGLYKRFSIFTVVLFKMILIPFAVIALLSPLPLNKILFGVLVLQMAMPGQSVLTIIANEYNADYQYATECIFITTVCCLATLPLVYWFMSLFV
ncbi:MAG: AEC family transporter [Clostridia bacterium]|nr:AEC family transporter [Clostridia bacterium]